LWGFGKYIHLHSFRTSNFSVYDYQYYVGFFINIVKMSQEGIGREKKIIPIKIEGLRQVIILSITIYVFNENFAMN